MSKMLLIAAAILFYPVYSFSQQFTYNDNWNNEGFTVVSSSPQSAILHFSIESWTLSDISVNRETMKKIDLPGHFLPNDEGMPDLPGSGRYIAMPQGAVPHLHIISMQMETLSDIDIAPAPRIPKTTENGPLVYAKNLSAFNRNEFYPAEPIRLSEPTKIRGVDLVMLGITPFQYNPVTKELKVIRNIEVEITFEGGNGQFGDNRLRSKWWDPLLADIFVNYNQLPIVDYSGRQLAVSGQQSAGNRTTGYEYLIICPNDPVFTSWADTIRMFRNQQGILTGIVTTDEIGGNTVSAIRTYINNAYNTWDIPPAAILILGDYGTSGATVISPIWDSYCASDNIFADVNNDDLPDIVISRIAAQNATHLEIMIDKFIGYETNPPVDPEYYAHPVTALGWQTERWFQVCIEVVGGFFRNVLDKEPVRVNAVYDGNPNVDPWSTAPNTSTIMNYFGPNGLDYIPSSPSSLGNWSGGTPNQINAAINSGSFMLLHRDHGYELGWGEPAYSSSSMSGLDNEHLTFVYSVNCLTGKFNYSGECFAEAFHRRPQRALGVIAASEVSYSFVNDTYVWGAFDNMWPEFMPDYGSTPEAQGLLPAFSNAAGKFFLEQSSWPYNAGNKEVTYHLFHHFGDAFSTLYSEVPQDMLIVHNDVVIGGLSTFTVQADEYSYIALSVGGEIIGTAEGTGSPVDINIISQVPGTVVDIVITKTNYFRYETSLQVISPNTPYVVYGDHSLDDGDGNGNGLLDYAENSLLGMTMMNIGSVAADNVTVVLSTPNPYISITDGSEYAGSIPGNQDLFLPGAFSFTVADSIPDGQMVQFVVTSDDGDSTWNSEFVMEAHAPVLNFVSFTINDDEGNDNGKIDPGETVEIHLIIENSGSAGAFGVMTGLSCTENYLTILSPAQSSDELGSADTSEIIFSVSADPNAPGGLNAEFTVDIQANHNRSGQGTFTCVIGQYSALILDLDPTNNSAPFIIEAFSETDLIADYSTSIPADLSIYKSVFLCLGIYYSSYQLREAEVQVLREYLENGGKIYMEGRLTWHTDQQTSLHSMFNVTTEPVNWYEYDNIYSIDGTFTEGLEFSYEMTQPYNNHFLHAVVPAFEIMNAMPDSMAVMVAYDAGNYKTIGSNIEFGGLIDGTSPSTKEELLSRILEFFGDILTGTDEKFTLDNSIEIKAYPNPFKNDVTFSFSLTRPAQITLEICDLAGRAVATLIDSRLTAGDHQYSWNAENQGISHPGGLYFYRFKSGNEIKSGKLMLIN